MATRHVAATLVLSGLLGCFELLSLVCLCRGDSPVGSLCREAEKEALLQFKRVLSDPANRLSSWVEGSDCCGWSGVGCDNRTGHVVKLDLRNPHPPYYLDVLSNSEWRLGGEIGPSLLGLRRLAYLDLSMNNFGGRPIPEFVGSFHQLTYLDLSQANLGGRIPPHLGNLSRLQSLYISNTGGGLLAVDDAGWVSRLSSLRQLRVEGVNMASESTRLLEALNMLPSISSVRLPFCELGSLPSLPHVNFTSLSILDISGNWIQTPFPEWLPNITSLTYLDLSGNMFQGGISPAIGSISSLEVLVMFGRYLGGKLPRSLRSLCKLRELCAHMDLNFNINELGGSFSGCIRSSLQVLDLNYNRLNGVLPAWLGDLKRLSYLSLWGNSLQGPLPAFLGRISSLQTLSLGSNMFNGSIPHSLGGLSQLTYLDLSNNLLQGSIPESLGGLASLQILYLHENNLSGTIPLSLSGLSGLRALDVSFNRLEGTVSTAHLSKLGSLESLAMASNNLIFDISSNWVPPFKLSSVNMASCRLGPLFPSWLRLQERVNSLNLSNSGISDTIPDSHWRSTSVLDDLDLSNNNISGRLPDSLIQVTHLKSLTLRSNRLEGEVPRLSSKIAFLDLSNNSFAGAISEDIGEIMPSLNFLSLYNNRLNGSIPRSLCRVQDLVVLDVSRNYLSGDIPDCWKAASSTWLQVLNLAHNYLVGVIPSSLGFFSNLELLQLNGNSLSGDFPPPLMNCSKIVALDLSGNKFIGEIPAWVAARMPSLRVLRLRSNNFTGNIPPNLSSLTYLQVIDLANNNLSGTIPSSFGDFPAMRLIHNISETFSRYLSFELHSYRGSVDVMTRGRMSEYQRLLPLVVSMDLSDNMLSGSIPQGLVDLLGLQSMNISGNMLTGGIMPNINALRWLETLDLSRNKLSGTIPTFMSSMTFMSRLNLSFNNFSGKIPAGNQFCTFTDPSIYMGNPYLCGFPLDKPCEGEGEPGDGVNKDESEEDRDSNVIWFYLVVVLGFILGFWAVCGTLIIHRRWRIMFFVLIDDVSDQLYVFVVVNVRRLRMLAKNIQWQH